MGKHEKEITELLENYGIENSTKENLTKDIMTIIDSVVLNKDKIIPSGHIEACEFMEFDKSDLLF
jgi:hypothetical protein